MPGHKDILKVTIGGSQISSDNLYSCTVEQQFNRHHSFECWIYTEELRLQHAGNSLDTSRDWIGKVISFSMDTGSLKFNGLVCDVYSAFKEREYIVLKGYSPTILLTTTGGHYQAYTDLTLDRVVQKIRDKIGGNTLKWKINSSTKHTLNYITQYKESFFDFLNRLSATFGEMFFYDGEQLHFGKPAISRQADVVYTEGVSEFTISMHALPLNFQQYSHDYLQTDLIKSSPPELILSNKLAKYAYDKSKVIFRTSDLSPAESDAKNIAQLKEEQKIKRKSIASGLIEIEGNSKNHSISIGCCVNVKKSEHDKQVDLGKFLITKIKHEFSPGKYSNSFSGVLADVDVLNVENVLYPIAEQQVGHVKDNDDPQKLGRVKVKLLWHDERTTTDWIRILTPHAGDTDRGIIFIPLKEDEVIVGFHYGNPDMPFVAGSIYNRNHSDILPQRQSITTQNGSELVFFNDGKENYMSLSDLNGNEISIDTTRGIIKVFSKGDIKMECGGELNIIGETLNLTAKTLFEVNAGDIKLQSNSFTTTVGMDYRLEAASINETSRGDFICHAANNIEHVADGDLIYKTTNGDITIDSLEMVKFRGKRIE